MRLARPGSAALPLCLAALACSTTRNAGGGGANGGGAAVASVDVQLPDKAKLSPALQKALTYYLFKIESAAQGGCESGDVSQTGEYEGAVKFDAKLLQRCDYSYTIMLGSKEQVAKTDGIYFAQGGIVAKDLAGKASLALDVKLSLTQAGKDLGFGDANLHTEAITDVSINVGLPAAASIADRIAAGETVVVTGKLSEFYNGAGGSGAAGIVPDGATEAVRFWVWSHTNCPDTKYELKTVTDPNLLQARKLPVTVTLGKMACESGGREKLPVQAAVVREN